MSPRRPTPTPPPPTAPRAAAPPEPPAPPDGERKERVLHTRIPESLEDAIKARAAGLGVSVSNLVRNVLSNTFGLVEGIVADSADLARAVVPAPAQLEAPRILGWHEAILELNAVCDRCNQVLARGTRAAIAVTTRDAPNRPIRCLACLEELRHDD
jgi:hypothetical protein